MSWRLAQEVLEVDVVAEDEDVDGEVHEREVDVVAGSLMVMRSTGNLSSDITRGGASQRLADTPKVSPMLLADAQALSNCDMLGLFHWGVNAMNAKPNLQATQNLNPNW
eukprot:3253838-Amphidinium_carterae.1